MKSIIDSATSISAGACGQRQSYPWSEWCMHVQTGIAQRLVGAITIVALSLGPVWAQVPFVVYGNLGPTGTTPLGTTNTDIGSQDPVDVNWLAQGFNTGNSPYLKIEEIQLGLFGVSEGTTPLAVAIFSDVSGDPGSALFTSADTNVGNTGLYSFSFETEVLLNQNTSYFVVPLGGSWYFNTGSPAGPIGQNSSGYSYTSTRESYNQGTSPAGPWGNDGTSTRYSVSVLATPEPSSFVIAGIGLPALAWIAARRRKSPRASAADSASA